MKYTIYEKVLVDDLRGHCFKLLTCVGIIDEHFSFEDAEFEISKNADLLRGLDLVIIPTICIGINGKIKK